MQARPPTQHPPEQGTDERLHAPAHVIDLLLAVMRRRAPRIGLPPGTVDYARAARAEACTYADRIWAEAYLAGAEWGLAHNTQPIKISAERFDELAQEVR